MSDSSPSSDLPLVQLVRDTSIAPYPSICYQWIARRKLGWRSTFTSSAVLIGERHLLTAAHNLYSPLYNRVSETRTVLGVDTDREWKLDGPFHHTQVSVAAGYGWGNFDRDYAVAPLPQPSPRKTDFRLPRPGETPMAQGTVVHVAGFPAAKGFEPRKLYGGSGAVARVGASTFHYAVDTGGGMSGCPVWVEQRTDARVEYVLVGVHVGFSGGFALARRVDEPGLLKDVEAWMRK